MHRPGRPEEGSDKPNFSMERCHFFTIMDNCTIQDRQLVTQRKFMKRSSQQPPFSSEKLLLNQIESIPREFVRKFGKKLSDEAVLKDPSGKFWHVGLRKADGKVWFQNGWQDFLEYHSIRDKHLLVFRYDGNSRFYVCIFDSTASEIEYPCDSETYEENILKGGCQAKEEQQEEDSLSVEIIGIFPSSQDMFDKFEDQTTKIRGNPLFRRLRSSIRNIDGSKLSNIVQSNRFAQSHGSRKLGVKEFSVSRAHRAESDTENSSVTERPSHKVFVSGKVPMTTKERKRTLPAAARAFKSENPFFTVTMRPSYVNNRFFLNVPSNFAQRYLRNTQIVMLQDMDGRTWPVRYTFERGYGHGKISEGWRVFARENNLKEGDVCIFELVKKSPIELKVFIFRVC